ncbi:unnamed protein product, partial [Symbiodinium pilosum]
RICAFSGVAAAVLAFERLLPLPCFSQPAPTSKVPKESTNEDVLTTEELKRAAKRLNVELRENVAGPWYQIELWSGDRQLGKTSGWAQPWGSLHLETIEVRKFTGYWVAKPARGEAKEPEQAEADQAAVEAEEKKRYADIAKVARWFGLLLSMAIACWNRERSPFFCKEAFLLAIYDEDKQHERLVRYYKGLGFKVIKDAESIDYQDQVIWGGQGTLMRTDEGDFMRRWTPVVRQLAGPKRMGRSDPA